MKKPNLQQLLVVDAFSKLGGEVIFWQSKQNANGPDCFVSFKKGQPRSVEVKPATHKVNGSLQVPPVEPKRRDDDLIAIVINNAYVLIEPMADHLKCCSPKGTRQLTLLRSNSKKDK